MPTERKPHENKKQYHARLKKEAAVIKKKMSGTVIWNRGTCVGRITKSRRAAPRLSTRPRAIEARSRLRADVPGGGW